MKKLIAVLAFFLVVLFSSEHSYAFDFGLKLGYTASKLSTNLDSIKSSMSSGFHVGAFVRFGKRVLLQPEFYYNLSGATFENLGAGTLDDWKQKVTIGSLDIPVLIGFSIIESKSFRWRIMVGPEVSFLVNSKIEDINLTGPIEKSDLRTTSWFLQAGTGVDFLFLTLDVRYQAGLNSLISDVTGKNGVVYPVNSKGNLVVVSLGFKII